MKIVIIGGGISGLTVAYALLERGQGSGDRGQEFDVTVFEADARAGGKIWSDKGEGFLCEKGANGFLDNKPKTLELCRDLGIVPLKSSDNARKRYIFSGGRLNALPESPPDFLKSKLISWPGKLRMAYEIIAPKGPENETVADFIIRRLGKEALEKLIDPMCSGIFAGDPYKMTITHCFPRIKELEQEYGSLIRAMIKLQKARGKGQGASVGPAPAGNLTSFYEGAQTITDALAQRLEGRIKLGVSVKGIAHPGGSACGGKKENSYQLHTSDGVVDADIVVLASPAFVSAEILRDIDMKLSKALSGIPYPSVSVVCFGYKRDKVGHSLQGFGFLTPHTEGRKILGTLWDSSIFPNRAPEGYVLLRSMVGGAQSPNLALLNDNELINTVFDELKPVVSLKAEPDMVRIYRWEKAIPQYVMGHGEKLRVIDEAMESYQGLYITGNAYRGISINDCIENGYKLADEILSKIKN